MPLRQMIGNPCWPFTLALLVGVGGSATETISVSSNPPRGDSCPSVATNQAGDVAFAWFRTSSTAEGRTESVVRRFSGGKTDASSEFAVDRFQKDGSHQPSVALSADGSLVVVKEVESAEGRRAIVAQLVSSDGGSMGKPMHVGFGARAGCSSRPRIRPVGDGFLAVWTDDQYDGRRSIHARRLSAAGRPDGRAIEVFAGQPFDQIEPAIVADPKHGVLLLWTQWLDHWGDRSAIMGRLIEPGGALSGSVLSVAEGTRLSGPAGVWLIGKSAAVFWLNRAERTVQGVRLGLPDGAVDRRLDLSSKLAPVAQSPPQPAINDDGRIEVLWSAKSEDRCGVAGIGLDAVGLTPISDACFVSRQCAIQPRIARVGRSEFVVSWLEPGGLQAQWVDGVSCRVGSSD